MTTENELKAAVGMLAKINDIVNGPNAGASLTSLFNAKGAIGSIKTALAGFSALRGVKATAPARAFSCTACGAARPATTAPCPACGISIHQAAAKLPKPLHGLARALAAHKQKITRK